MSDEQPCAPLLDVRVLEKKWLSEIAFELHLEKPSDFSFRPGQKVSCEIDGQVREYSLACSPLENRLVLCIRYVPGGLVSAGLAAMDAGDTIKLSYPYGFFLHRSGKSVFVATGTGIAPYVAYCKSGVAGYILLHGVSLAGDLYYRESMKAGAGLYVPCLTSESDETVAALNGFGGRVTGYLQEHLEEGKYDFYLCGNGEMVRDAMRIIDARFPQSRVFTETFFIN